MKCDCKFVFSHDNIIEFFKVCKKHQRLANYIDLIKRIVIDAEKWYARR